MFTKLDKIEYTKKVTANPLSPLFSIFPHVFCLLCIACSSQTGLGWRQYFSRRETVADWSGVGITILSPTLSTAICSSLEINTNSDITGGNKLLTRLELSYF